MKLAFGAVVFCSALLIAGVVLIFTYPKPPTEPPQEEVVLPEPKTKIYRSDAYGISFTYPSQYVLTEKEVGDAHRSHYAIVLIHEKDLPVPKNSDGPTAITIDIYQNNLDKQPLLDWLRGSNASNFKLGPGIYASTTFMGVEAVQYQWSGLYEGETTAFLHKDNVIAISVTYQSPQDPIIADYRNLFSSLQFIP
jgi:hypothetical protein